MHACKFMLRKVFLGYFLTECCPWGNTSKVFDGNAGSEDPSAAPAPICSDLITSPEGQAPRFPLLPFIWKARLLSQGACQRSGE